MPMLVVEFSRKSYKKVFWLEIICSQMKLPIMENSENFHFSNLLAALKAG